MSVKPVELFHGAVLGKICRQKRVSVFLIERDDKQARSAYRIIDAVVMVKHSLNPKPLKGQKTTTGGATWSFTFMPKQLGQLDKYTQEKGTKEVAVALVCGPESIKKGRIEIEICFMTIEQVRGCVDLGARSARNVKVQWKKGERQFRVSGPKAGKRGSEERPIRIKMNALDDWDIPGAASDAAI